MILNLCQLTLTFSNSLELIKLSELKNPNPTFLSLGNINSLSNIRSMNGKNYKLGNEENQFLAVSHERSP